MKAYPQDFYTSRHQQRVYSANTVLTIILDMIPGISSVVDVGCGVGTWLSVLMEKGVKDVLGIDGNWVDQSLLVIPKEFFLQADLNKPIELSRRYDLAISLEVAEHLPSDSAKDFVISLIKLSDFVLFSAAVPFQGGWNHINEQWPHYWAELFSVHGYVTFDPIRRKIWNDKGIKTCYKQNILLFVRKERVPDIRNVTEDINIQFWQLSVVHPDMYLAKTSQMESVKGSWNLLRRALNSWFKRIPENFFKQII